MDFFVLFDEVDFMLVLLMYEIIFFISVILLWEPFIENHGFGFTPNNSFLFFLNQVFDPISEYL